MASLFHVLTWFSLNRNYIANQSQGEKRMAEGEVKSEDIRAKPEGWMQKIDGV